MENVKLALEINRMIHNECKEVPHDIGARIIELIEKDYDVKLILPAVGISVKEKHTLTFDEWLKYVKGFDLSNTESYIKELSLNFHKYNLKYKKWLEHQP